MAKDTIVFDFDGTIANIDHRVPLIHTDPPNWDKFFAECVNDVPNQWCIDLMSAMFHAGFMIKIVSARSRQVLNESNEWLKKNIPSDVLWELCMLREAGDSVPDTQLKKAWLDSSGFRDRILFVVDDRQKVVDAWRVEGLVCLQCYAWPEFKRSKKKEPARV